MVSKKQRAEKQRREAEKRKRERLSNSRPTLKRTDKPVSDTTPTILPQDFPKAEPQNAEISLKPKEKFNLPLLEVVFTIFLFGVQQGWAMSGFPPNIIAACVVWGLMLALLLHAFWKWEKTATLRFSLKLVISILVVIIVVGVLWKPVIEQYRKEYTLALNTSPMSLAQPTPFSTSTIPRTQETPNTELSAIEFNGEATKKLQSFFFRIELKRLYLLNEIGHFRTYFHLEFGGKVEIRVGCQGEFDKNGHYLNLERIWSDSKKAKHTSIPYSTIGQDSYTLDIINCSAISSKGIQPYQTVNDLEFRNVTIYATDSLVDKIKSISLVANNYKILSYDADKFVVNTEEPGVKWFVPLSDSEKVVRWQSIGLKPPSEKWAQILKNAEEIQKAENKKNAKKNAKAENKSGGNFVWGWFIDFSEFPPTKMPRYFQ